MAKEHLVFMTAEDVDDLIADLDDLNTRIQLNFGFIQDSEPGDYREVLKNNLKRLQSKRRELLRALKQSLEGME